MQFHLGGRVCTRVCLYTGATVESQARRGVKFLDEEL